MRKKERIHTVSAREILNGRGLPSIEVEIETENGFRGLASSPSGASVSRHEASEIRDGDSRYHGKGVQRSVDKIHEILSPVLVGSEIRDQKKIDQELISYYGTNKETNLGTNAITSLSLALANAASAAAGLPLYKYLGAREKFTIPILCPNMLSGSTTSRSTLEFEDYLIVPFRFTSVREAIRASVEVFQNLYDKFVEKFGSIPYFTALIPPLDSTREAIEYIMMAIKNTGYENRIGIAIDASATLLYDKATDTYSFQNKQVPKDHLISYYQDLAKTYPIVFIEDGLHEDDFEGFRNLTEALDCLIVGDDLFASNPQRLAMGIRRRAANAILLKINQVGTVSEIMRTAALAKRNGYTPIYSTRSSETNDSSQVDLAVAMDVRFMKVGAPIRGEMIAKYNRLLKIESELGKNSSFYGEEY